MPKVVISPMIPFPSLSWFNVVKDADIVIFDGAEQYQKMTYRNRYYLASKNGKMLMSIPLSNGRNQHVPIKNIKVSNAEKWQLNHWKTIQSLYANSPFFEFIDYQLSPFFTNEVGSLWDWSMATIEWSKKFLELDFEIKITDEYVKHYDDSVIDLRNTLDVKSEVIFTKYHQVFADNVGFIPDCSIIDLICCEGKQAINLI